MKTKNFLLWILTAFFSVQLCSCNVDSGKQNEKLANEIVKILKDIDKATNDSTLAKISLSVVDSDDIDNVQVIEPTEPDQRYIINVYTETDDSDFSDVPETLVACLAIIFIFGTPIFIAIIICICIVRVKKNSNQVAITAMEKGYRYPLVDQDIVANKLQSGIKMIAWAVGIFAFFMVVDATSVAVLALIPFIIGMGRLYAYYHDVRKIKSDKENNSNFPPVPPVNHNIDNSSSCDAL